MLRIEAGALIVLTRAALSMLPFATVCGLIDRFCGTSVASHTPDHSVIAGTRAAVEAASRRLPGSTCLVEAVVAQTMLRRRGVASTLHIGVRQPSKAMPLDAHAWVECEGVVVVGNTGNLGDYRVLVRPS